MNERPTVVPLLIIGGGLGGLALAVALAKRGRRVHLIEKNPEFCEVGAGLQLAPNASRTLDAIGVLPDVQKLAVFPKQLVWMDALSSEQLTTLDLGPAFIEHYGYPYIVMHRHDLLNTLLAAAQAEPLVTLEPGKDVLEIEDLGDAVDVRCGDGTVYRAEIVIGADGLWSATRRYLGDTAPPNQTGYVAYRGTAPIGEVSEHAGFDNVVVWTGPNRHLVQYPIRRGELFNQVAVFKSERFAPGLPDDAWGTPEELDACFSSCGPAVAQALRLFRRNKRWPMLDRSPLPTWIKGRVVLMGDAAHPMFQYLAQGACQAFEDVLCLANALTDFADHTDAFQAFEAERLPRTATVQTNARLWGAYWHLPLGPQKDLRDAALRAHAPDDFSATDWYYGYEAPNFLARS